MFFGDVTVLGQSVEYAEHRILVQACLHRNLVEGKMLLLGFTEDVENVQSLPQYFDVVDVRFSVIHEPALYIA
jgi:hypothetical protein